MSRFFSSKYNKLTPYTPGEQPRERQFIKLNTNESPFEPTEHMKQAASQAASRLQLYPDPECKKLNKIAAEHFGIGSDEILFTNGSDEILNFAFMAFCDCEHPAVFPDITYGFYPVFAQLNGIPYETVPLKDEFTIDVEDYIGINKNIFIANPNAPTGIALSVNDIERIVASNRDNIVVIDEAYVDFGAESCVPLIKKYDNIIVTQTFSKSRSAAGARLGFGIACKELIADLNTVKYSTNPYNINGLTMALGIAAFEDDAKIKENCRIIAHNRENTAARLKKLGFSCTASSTNFIFAKHSSLSGMYIYEKLRENGILVRHFSSDKIGDYNRITVGNSEQMDILVKTLKSITEENL